jgi:Tol biopolymer transport system component
VPAKASLVSNLLGVPLNLIGLFLDKFSSTLMGPTSPTSVYLVRLDDHQPEELFSFRDGRITSLRAAPDEKSIACARSTGNASDSEIWLFQLGSGDPIRLAAGRSPVWDRESRVIYFLHGAEFSRLRLSDNAVQVISSMTDPPIEQLLGFTRDQSPRILATSRLGSDSWQIWSINPETGERTKLSFDSAYLWLTYLSPDGASIVGTEYPGSTKKGTIFFQRLGQQRIELTDGTHDDDLPSWAPDGASVLFASDRKKSVPGSPQAPAKPR